MSVSSGSGTVVTGITPIARRKTASWRGALSFQVKRFIFSCAAHPSVRWSKRSGLKVSIKTLMGSLAKESILKVQRRRLDKDASRIHDTSVRQFIQTNDATDALLYSAT